MSTSIDQLNCIIVLGGLIYQKSDGNFAPSPNRASRPIAAAEIYKKNTQIKFVVSGGYNFGIRYTLDGQLIPEVNFDIQNFAQARHVGPSEASVFKNIMVNYGVPSNAIYLEEMSATTIENARFCHAIFSRTNFIKTKTDGMKVGLLTNSDHLERAMGIFTKEFSALNVDLTPLAAEDWISDLNMTKLIN